MSLICVANCYGQAVAAASIEGQVVDSSGAIVVGAAVKATHVETQTTHSVNTGVQGGYSLLNLPVGSYQLEVTANGFKTYTQSGILLEVGSNVRINVGLEVGALTQNVTVAADANLVETTNNSISQVVDQQRIVDLPLNGRQATQLILLSGGAANGSNASSDMTGSKSFYSSVTISIGGGQENSTNYLLDGGDNNDTFGNVNLPFPFPDALQEFSVDASSLPARNGMHPGGVVNAVTKSGTNSIHGDLFEFLRNGDLNDRNFFAATHDNLRRNQFGGTIGGKIIRDKLFFFGGYQGTRTVTAPPDSIAFVPTAAALNGDFSSLASAACQSNGKALTLVNPTTGIPYPNNQIPVTQFSSASLKLESYMPQTTNPCGKVTYAVPTPSSEDQYIGRIDYILTAKHALFGRYLITDYSAPAPWESTNILLTQTPGNEERAQILTFGDTYTFTPTIINSFHASFSRRRIDRGSSPNQINTSALGINAFVADPHALYTVVTNSFQTGCGTCDIGVFNVNSFQVADDVDLIHGKNQFAFGVNVLRSQLNVLNPKNPEFQFAGLGSASPLADFLLGFTSAPGSSGFSSNAPQTQQERASYPGLYAQDTIHVSSHLTVNVGVRWAPFLFPHNYFDKGSTFSMASFLADQHSIVFPNAPAGLLFYGDPGIPPSFVHNQWLNFTPRLGLVWSPTANGRQTIRVGAAQLYDSTAIYTPAQLIQAPWIASISVPAAERGPYTNPWQNYPGGDPLPEPNPPPTNATFPLSATYYSFPLNTKPTEVYNWNVSYQNQLGAWLGTVSYLGSKTTHLWLSQDIDAPVNIPGATTKNEPQREALYLLNPTQGQYYHQVVVLDNGGNASYNALVATVKRRFSHHYTVLANYTWSHCISDGDPINDLNATYYQNQYDRNAERGDCNFDIRQNFTGSFVAVSPVTANGWTGRLLRNWQLAPLVTLRTGAPLTVTSGPDNSLTGEGHDRPNLVPGAPVYMSSIGPNLQYLNPAAFTQNALGTFGNLGRATLNYPGLIGVDLALSRSFSLQERLKLEVRAEAFNAINHTNFVAYSANSYGGLSTALNSATFGRITAAGDPRILQFAMKVVF
jgi:hypothetical protein